MDNFKNKKIMAENLKYYLKLNNKTRKQLCEDLNFPYSTFNEWANAKAYPQIDKIEIMANYFNIEKSDLIEHKDYKEVYKSQPDHTELGQRIKELRLSKKMTLERLGDLVGVGKSTVRKWETGMITNMRCDKIPKLADALGTTPDFLTGLTSEINDTNKSNETDDIIKMIVERFTDEVKENICRIQSQNNKRVQHYKKWLENFKDDIFTEEEFDEVIDYAKYVLSKRKKE